MPPKGSSLYKLNHCLSLCCMKKISTQIALTCAICIYVLFKVLLPVYMKYATQGEGQVPNIYGMRQSQVLYLSQNSHQELSKKHICH